MKTTIQIHLVSIAIGLAIGFTAGFWTPHFRSTNSQPTESPALQASREELGKLLLTYTEENPRVKQMRERIRQLEAKGR